MVAQNNVPGRKLLVLVTSVAETSLSRKAAGRIIAVACVLSTLAGCSSPTAEQQVAAVAKKLQELNSGFDGHVTPTIENGEVTGLWFNTDKVTDISPVRALAGLKNLSCSGSRSNSVFTSGGRGNVMPGTLKVVSSGKLVDLSPLKGMPLTNLDCGETNVFDLSPLKGMPLTNLDCRKTNVSDLSPLKGVPLSELRCGTTLVSDFSPLEGMPLTSLDCRTTVVSDLSPLKGMPLTNLDCGQTNVSDLTPLKGMRLTDLSCESTQVSDLSPLEGMPLTELGCDGTNVSDLTALEGMKLTWFTATPKNITKGLEVIRQMKSLKTIGVAWGFKDRFPSDEFWKKYDAGEFGKANRLDAGTPH